MLQPKVERSASGRWDGQMQKAEASAVAKKCMLSGEQQEQCLADAVLCSQH